ncbi:MAG: FHA domain-containing protein [Actinomycetota bacterium]
MSEGCPHVADPGDRFCRRCGAALTESPEAVEETFVRTSGPPSTGSLPAVGTGRISGVAEGEAVLVVRRGSGEGTTYLLAGDIVTAGRAPEADLFLDDVTVSRHHAELHRTPEGWRIKDTESLNGTYVNRRRVEDHLLAPGDEGQIGKYRFAYLVGGDTGALR